MSFDLKINLLNVIDIWSHISQSDATQSIEEENRSENPPESNENGMSSGVVAMEVEPQEKDDSPTEKTNDNNNNPNHNNNMLVGNLAGLPIYVFKPN